MPRKKLITTHVCAHCGISIGMHSGAWRHLPGRQRAGAVCGMVPEPIGRIEYEQRQLVVRRAALAKLNPEPKEST